jgi:hypothetical protein
MRTRRLRTTCPFAKIRCPREWSPVPGPHASPTTERTRPPSPREETRQRKKEHELTRGATEKPPGPRVTCGKQGKAGATTTHAFSSVFALLRRPCRGRQQITRLILCAGPHHISHPFSTPAAVVVHDSPWWTAPTLPARSLNLSADHLGLLGRDPHPLACLTPRTCKRARALPILTRLVRQKKSVCDGLRCHVCLYWATRGVHTSFVSGPARNP